MKDKRESRIKKEFLREVKDNVRDTRFNHAEYLAAKFVVWQGLQYTKDKYPLDFLSLGICMEDPCDIDYRYIVVCAGKNLKVFCMRVAGNVSLGEVYPEFTVTLIKVLCQFLAARRMKWKK